MQIIQQLSGSLVQRRLDAGTAQPIDGVLDGVQVGLGGVDNTGDLDSLVQVQDILLHLV